MGLGDLFKKQLDEASESAEAVVSNSAAARERKRARALENPASREDFVFNDESSFSFDDAFFLETASVTCDDDEDETDVANAGATASSDGQEANAAPAQAPFEIPDEVSPDGSSYVRVRTPKQPSHSLLHLDVCERCGSTNTRIVKQVRRFDGRTITRHCDTCGHDWTRVYL